MSEDKEIVINKETKEAGIAFCLPGELVYGVFEEPGIANVAMRLAIEDAMIYFQKRFAYYAGWVGEAGKIAASTAAAMVKQDTSVSEPISSADPVVNPEEITVDELERLYNHE